MSRRKFIGISASAAALVSSVPCLFPRAFGEPGSATSSESVPTYLQDGSKKKGLGITAANNPGYAEKLIGVHAKWFYTWAGFVPGDAPPGMTFVPMIRSRHAGADMVAKIRQSIEPHSSITELLGLNEPDAESQDHMSVEAALDFWPTLMETGLRLGSPGCVHPDNDWMTEFMNGVESRKLRVDFVCVHSYGQPNPAALVSRLEKIHRLYDRPLWTTEFAVGDWRAKSVEVNQHSAATVLRFMEKVLPMLDRLDCLERYEWFPAKPDNRALGTSALFDADGGLTRLGECYRDA